MTWRPYLLAIWLISPLLLFAAPATAQALNEQEIERRFKAFDTNGDGRISREEWELNKVVVIFDSRERAAAASGAPPGTVDRQIAITRAASRLSPEAFATLDTNGDGVLSGSEIIASDLLQFENIDKNGDGYIDRAEFNALIDRLFK
jgi:Ca2+-binding EF-hand superfamily protein